MRKIALVTVALLAACLSAGLAQDAKQVLEATGVQGGLVVVIGCGDPGLLAGLRPNERYLVHGLDTDAAKVGQARQAIQARGLYGKVSVDRFDGKHLPYAPDLVNLIVASVKGQVTGDEIARVLAPRGRALVRSGSLDTRHLTLDTRSPAALRGWTLLTKPVPQEIDEWTHFLHDASSNAVAKDRQVGPPKRLRWVAGPRWCRSHEFPSSVNAVVSAGGRIFTIFDEGQTGLYKKMPQRCKLIARDAANGVLLWKVPMQEWQPEFGTGIGNRWQIHHTIPRRLVAVGDPSTGSGRGRVYVTLRFLGSPVSVLDAATGKVVVEALEGTKGTDEMILSDGILIVKITEKRSVAATARFRKEALDDTLAAVDVKTGKPLWRKEHVRVVPYALSAQGGRVVYHSMDDLVCLDARTGSEIWRSPSQIASTAGGSSNLVLSDGVVLFNGHAQPPGVAAPPKKAPPKKGRRQPAGRLYLMAVSLADGKFLWSHPSRTGWSAACTQPTDLFVTNGLVWCATFQGRDIQTGEVKKTIDVGELISPGHHYRCHRSKATERFLILPKRGAEFVDVEGDAHMRNDWLRAPCFTGATPANGLFYAPTDQCFCYPGVKVAGYLAMSAEPVGKLAPATDANLERGPAFGEIGNRKSEIANGEDWPMYRHDVQRSGSTRASVPAELRKQWEAKLLCQPSPPVIVGDRLWVAEKDAHRIRCLNAADGKDVWSFTAGGRVDSAPTVQDGLVLFGCRDGSVYCLRAADGALVWRFRAAPDDRRLVSFEQVESVWPVHGSVLVQGGVVYFAAGRSSFLDGGILVYGLDAATGKVLHHHRLEGPWPDVKKDTGTPFAMEGALPDLLVSDGNDLYMQRIKFDAKLSRLKTRQESPLGELDMGAMHLVATGGFLDDTGFDRVYWMYSKRWPGFYFAQHSPKAGQLVVFDDATTFAVKYFYRRIVWSPLLIPGGQGYLLFADANDNEPILDERGQKSKAIQWLPKEAYSDKYRRGGRGVEKGTGYVRERPAKWQKMIPVRVRAMVLAGDRLVVAGPPDVVDKDDPYAAFEGRKGAVLQVFSASDGALLKQHPLAAPPVFDGMAAARGRLYLSAEGARLVCFAAR